MSNSVSNVWLEIASKNQKILICAMYYEFSDLTIKGQMSVNEQLERLKLFHSRLHLAKEIKCDIYYKSFGQRNDFETHIS